jgi:hypothetical protein
MPVIMDSGIADVRLVTGMPKKMFGESSDRLVLAMRNVMYCNVPLLLTHQNDTDGDAGRITLTGGILPMFTKLPDYLDAWVAKYSEDEYKMELSYKEYKAYPRIELDAGVRTAVEAKGYVGRAANDIFFLRHILSLFNLSKKGTVSEFVRRRSMNYVCGFQEQIMRGIKHTVGGEYSFRDCSMVDAMSTKNHGDWVIAMRDLHAAFDGNDVDFSKLDKEFEQFIMKHLFTAVNSKIFSPVLTRRASSIKKITTATCSAEGYMKVLDVFTRAFARNVIKSAPKMFHYNKEEKDIANMIFSDNEKFKGYMKRYLLSGQDMSRFLEGTAHGLMLLAIKNKFVADDEKEELRLAVAEQMHNIVYGGQPMDEDEPLPCMDVRYGITGGF